MASAERFGDLDPGERQPAQPRVRLAVGEQRTEAGRAGRGDAEARVDQDRPDQFAIGYQPGRATSRLSSDNWIEGPVPGRWVQC